jgi:Zn finger protein HypA/HybF involved in hydrogenase expression
MPDFRIKKITLPSGKVVEIVYLQAVADEHPGGRVVETEVRRIELCPSCTGERVQPLDWREVDEAHWELRVRCPDCRWHATGVFEQREVERYDDVLAADTDRLIAELDRVTRENMAEHLERFRVALEHDAIEPMDF